MSYITFLALRCFVVYLEVLFSPKQEGPALALLIIYVYKQLKDIFFTSAFFGCRAISNNNNKISAKPKFKMPCHGYVLSVAE